MFAKLFETKKHGQILVKLDSGEGDTEAEVRFYAEPPRLGVCSFAAGFKGDDAWAKAEACFALIDADEASRAAESLFATAAGFTPNDED